MFNGIKKPDYRIKLGRTKLPVFKTPFTYQDYQNLLLNEKVTRFGIHNQKTGKLKVFDFEQNRVPRINQLFKTDIGFFNGVKLIGLVVVGWYGYKVLRWRPKLNIKPKRPRITMEEWKLKYNKTGNSEPKKEATA